MRRLDPAIRPTTSRRLLRAGFALVAGLVVARSIAQTSELHWEFTPDLVSAGFATWSATPPATGQLEPTFGPARSGGGLVTNTHLDALEVTELSGVGLGRLPAEDFTVAAWVAIESPRRWGGIVGCVQDNGDYEKGWVLGYDEAHFTFALSTVGADDGDGRLTYLGGTSDYSAGGWHHVVATYDGATMSLYVDGELEANSADQSGAVLYDVDVPFVIGAYRDSNENHSHDGRIREVKVLGRVASAEEVRTWADAGASLSSLDPWSDLEFGFLVPPYLTWPTTEAISILFETTFPSTATVRVRRADQEPEQGRVHRLDSIARLHELRVDGLEPDAKYFYSVEATSSAMGEVRSELLSFRTAASRGRPFTFVAIGDTQSQADVVKRVSDLAWMHRPNLVVHAGDLVDSGSVKSDWTGHFFPAMQPLIGRVALMPVLGNHEQDAEHYYRYMSLPEPERWYTFSFGDADFFMIDGNRSLAQQSAQLAWLEGALSESDALWKFAVLHQPPYTSDSDDYGDTFRTTSLQGDPNVRNIVTLLERYGVDICFSGHVHDYERTFPILADQVAHHADGGVIYVTSAGGGGSLENFDPANTWFGHKKARYHHLVYVAVNGRELEFQAIDEHGRLFDVMKLEKPAGR